MAIGYYDETRYVHMIDCEPSDVATFCEQSKLMHGIEMRVTPEVSQHGQFVLKGERGTGRDRAQIVLWVSYSD